MGVRKYSTPHPRHRFTVSQVPSFVIPTHGAGLDEMDSNSKEGLSFVPHSPASLPLHGRAFVPHPPLNNPSPWTLHGPVRRPCSERKACRESVCTTEAAVFSRTTARCQVGLKWKDASGFIIHRHHYINQTLPTNHILAIHHPSIHPPPLSIRVDR